MDKLDHYRQLIRNVLSSHTHIPYSYGNIEFETVFDRDSDRYLVMIVGREGVKRVHGNIIHVDIINEKIWVQNDGTEVGVANQFVEAGVPKDQIVLGFRSATKRAMGEFAVS